MEWQEKLEREREKKSRPNSFFFSRLSGLLHMIIMFWSLNLSLNLSLNFISFVISFTILLLLLLLLLLSTWATLVRYFFFGNVNDDHDDKKRYSGANLNQQQQNVKVLFFLALFIIENYESFGKIYDFEFHNFHRRRRRRCLFNLYESYFLFCFRFFWLQSTKLQKKVSIGNFFFSFSFCCCISGTNEWTEKLSSKRCKKSQNPFIHKTARILMMIWSEWFRNIFVFWIWIWILNF